MSTPFIHLAVNASVLDLRRGEVLIGLPAVLVDDGLALGFGLLLLLGHAHCLRGV